MSNILKKQPTRAAGNKILSKFTNVLQYLHMKISQQMKIRFFDNSANMATIYSIQNIRNSITETYCKKCSVWLHFWYKYMFENMYVFHFTKKLNLWKELKKLD